MKAFFKNVLNKTTLYYTVIIALFCSVMLLTHSSESDISLDPSRMLLFLPFCIAFSIANTVLQYKNIEAVTRWILHFVLTTLSAFVFIILPADLTSSSGNFMGLVVIVALYLLGVMIYAIFGNRVRKTIRDDKQLRVKENKRK